MTAVQGAGLRILIVDDSELNREMTRALVSKMGHVPMLADSGPAAIQIFKKEHPDLAMIDAEMPGMDGFETARQLRTLTPATWFPVIFLTAAGKRALWLKEVRDSGDDYLAKPIDYAVMEAKVSGYGRTLGYYRQLQAANLELLDYRDTAEEEKLMAAHLLGRLLAEARRYEESGLRFWSLPTEAANGDILLAERTPDGRLHVLLADGTGHGLAAALTTLPLVQPFLAMTRKGFHIERIVRQLNDIVHRMLPADRFAAALFLAIDPVLWAMQVWNAGMPTVLLLDGAGAVIGSFPSRNLPLGISHSRGSAGEIDTHRLEPGSWILAHSDGLIEAENNACLEFGEERLAEALPGPVGAPLVERIKRAVFAYAGEVKPRDDITLALIECDAVFGRLQLAAVEPVTAVPNAPPRTGWSMRMHFGPQQLRTLDLIPVLHDTVRQIIAPTHDTSSVFVVLTELFNNALEHGLLRLDSALKTLEAGMEDYYAERERRLAVLTEGSIDVVIEEMVEPRQSALAIEITDTGPGFNVGAVFRELDRGNSLDRISGRGIGLVRNLSRALTYSLDGRHVRAEILLGELS